MNRKERRAAGKGGQSSQAQALGGDAFFQLGLSSLQSGQPQAAVGWFDKALAATPRVPEWQFYRAVAAHMLRQLDDAERHYRRAMSLRPDFAEAMASLAGLLGERGQQNEAAPLFRRALALRPNDPDMRRGFATLLLTQGASGLRSEAERQWLSGVVLELSHQPAGRLPEIRAAAAWLIKAHPVLGPVVAQVAEAWPQRLAADRLLAPEVIAATASDGLLDYVLRSDPVADIALEQFLTSLRLALLPRAETKTQEPDDLLRLACAMAKQCFINEYVFAISVEEAERMAKLRERIAERLADVANVPALWLAVAAAYAPLRDIAGIDAALNRNWPEAVRDLLQQQVAEPAEEERLRETIPRLTPIGDAVSQAVQRQYEDNPYPRWVEARPVANPGTLDDHLRMKFAATGFRPLGKGRDIAILVAGCGTGQHAIDVARQFPGASMLAIDLSRVSLAYAIRKTRALGLDRIEYGQADILELGALDRRFDLIVAMGALHHLVDPFGGWRVLASLLVPNGVMNIGLYSAAARREVVAARTYIAARGYRPDAAGIRRFREDVLRDADSPLKTYTASADFFTISDCRDLFFHVQEQRLTLPAIKGYLAEAGFDFLGFDLLPQTLQAYAAAAPEDKTMTDLDRWHAFEMQHPQTFRSMYQFWVQRRL